MKIITILYIALAILAEFLVRIAIAVLAAFAIAFGLTALWDLFSPRLKQKGQGRRIA